MNLNEFLNSEQSEIILPLFKELAIDFETGETITKEDEIIMLSGTEAILVWVWKALKTDSNVYRAYSDKFGNRLSDEIGYIYDREIRGQLINSMIEDCLLYNPYITRVYEFEHIFDEDTLNLNVSFKIDTIYGTIDTKEVSRLNVKTSI